MGSVYVPNMELTATSPLGDARAEIGAVTIAEVTGKALVSVATPLGGEAALAEALSSAYGIDVPAAGRVSDGERAQALGLARDQMFLVFDHPGPWPEKAVDRALGGAGYVTDQSDSWVMIHVAGDDARRALERICPIDLHPGVFAPGHLARTAMEHLGAIIVAEPDGFLLMSARSSARSFWHAIEVSARNIT